MIKPLTKNDLVPLGLTAAAEAGIHKKILLSENMTTWIISND